MRLGRQAVLRPRLVPDPQPEFAFESVPWLDPQASARQETTVIASQLRCRPLRLLRSPQPLAVQQFSTEGLPTLVQRSTVIRTSGPERIEVGWWRGLDVKRDYYRLSLANGAILWAFVDRDTGNWFLHGLFV